MLSSKAEKEEQASQEIVEAPVKEIQDFGAPQSTWDTDNGTGLGGAVAAANQEVS